MKPSPPKVLTQMIKQYQDRHHRLPDEIIVHPVALAALALKKSVAPRWNGIKVKCRLVKPGPCFSPRRLGITVYDGALRGFDL